MICCFIVSRPPLLYVIKSLSDLQQTVQMAFAGCFIFLIQSFSEMTSGSLDVHIIFGWDFITSIVTVFSNHSHLHLFARPASKSSAHSSPDYWRNCCKTDILFCPGRSKTPQIWTGIRFVNISDIKGIKERILKHSPSHFPTPVVIHPVQF